MPKSARFNTILGFAPGEVPVFSSDYATADETIFPDRKSYRSYVDGIFMGYKWQCVEFARRWLYLNYGLLFDNVPMAYDIFHLRSLRSAKNQTLLPVYSFLNGAKRQPEPGCLLIWQEGGEFEETGHVAIVTEVSNDRIRIAEQNVDHCPWPQGQNYSRELPAYIDADGGYHIRCSFDDTRILGWVIQTEDSTNAENFTPPNPALFNMQLATLAETDGKIGLPPPSRPDEHAYIAAMGGLWLSRDNVHPERYLRLSESALGEIRHASNELHAMFMHATDFVLDSDELLERFGFPAVIWPRLRHSWNNRRNHLITGRLDFSVSERGIKLYEYNADSASCYMECGHIQGLWAKFYHCNDGWDPGHHLREALVHAWKKCHIEGLIHIMQDNDAEETYHALFMQSAMTEAGIRSKIIRGLSDLEWNKHGEVVDRDGERIRRVWKTWAWETALDQLRIECADEQMIQLPDSRQYRPHPPRLVDVLLTPEVIVFEPLWSLVPSNKAILPLLFSLYPDYPCLLNTQFEPTRDLHRTGYVIKPIVGRCGENISIVNRRDQIIEETSGQFKDRDDIYQELFELPKLGQHHLQLSTFMVDARYAGACVRADQSPIITGKSDVIPLRIVADDTL